MKQYFLYCCMDTFNEKPLSQDDLKVEIERILGIIKAEKNEEFYLICQRFIGSIDTIERYKEMGEELRKEEYAAMIDEESSRAMQYSQINFCVLLSLTDDELVNLKIDIEESRARRDGFENLEARQTFTRELAQRMARILELAEGDDYRKAQIGRSLHGRHTAMFMHQYIFNIPFDATVEERCYLLMMHSDKEHLDNLLEPSIKKAEDELEALMEA